MFVYSTVASGLHDAESVRRIVAPVVAQLDELGGTPTDEPRERPDRAHVIVVATGGTEQAVLDVVERRRGVAPREPVVLVAHDLHNSLPAALESLARIRHDGGRGRIVLADDRVSVAETIADLRAAHAIDGARIGLVGRPSEWLVASVPDRDELRARWGVELVDVDIADTIATSRAVDRMAARPVAVRFAGTSAPSPELERAAVLHPALTATIERAAVDAVAVRCFDFLTELETSGCVALAELNDTGVVAGCEGDVASTVAMLLVRELFGVPGWIANPAAIDVDAGELVLAHCTVAPSLVDGVELHTHFESGLGIGLRGEFSPGPVTLLRLGGAGLGRRWFAEADIVGSGSAPDLCRTQVRVRVTDRDVAELLDDPLGNHLVMIPGHRRRRLERWCELVSG